MSQPTVSDLLLFADNSCETGQYGLAVEMCLHLVSNLAPSSSHYHHARHQLITTLHNWSVDMSLTFSDVELLLKRYSETMSLFDDDEHLANDLGLFLSRSVFCKSQTLHTLLDKSSGKPQLTTLFILCSVRVEIFFDFHNWLHANKR